MTIDNVTKHRDIKLIIDKRRNQLVPESNYHTTICFSKKLLAIEMQKIKVKMTKLAYPDMSTLGISRTLMYEFWYDYMEPKYQNNPRLCYMDTDIFIIHIKTEDVYEDFAGDVEKKI